MYLTKKKERQGKESVKRPPPNHKVSVSEIAHIGYEFVRKLKRTKEKKTADEDRKKVEKNVLGETMLIQKDFISNFDSTKMLQIIGFGLTMESISLNSFPPFTCTH